MYSQGEEEKLIAQYFKGLDSIHVGIRYMLLSVLTHFMRG